MEKMVLPGRFLLCGPLHTHRRTLLLYSMICISISKMVDVTEQHHCTGMVTVVLQDIVISG